MVVLAPPHSGSALTRIHLATALVRRGERVLMVASSYPNHQSPLWNLPGGRQQHGELLMDTAIRELREETVLEGTVRELLYVSESYDGETHFTNFTFALHATGEARASDAAGDHIVDVAWLTVDEIEKRVAVHVVREPLLAHLLGSAQRYFAYAVAGISIDFPD